MQEWITHSETGTPVHLPTAILTCEAMLTSLRNNQDEIDQTVFGNIMRDQSPSEVFEALVMGLKDAMEKVAEGVPPAEIIERVNEEDGS